MRFLTAVCLACTTYAATAAGAAELFKWTDKDGTVHYGDTQHPNSKFITIKSSNGEGPDAKTVARGEACKKEKADFERYKAATGLQQVDALGNVKPLSDAEREQFLDKQELKVKELCGPSKEAAAAPQADVPPPAGAPPGAAKK